MNAKNAARVVVLACLAINVPGRAQSSPQAPYSFPLWNFDEEYHTCRAAGRLQDRRYCQSQVMDTIVAQGKNAIPILIAQLTDSRKTTEPIFDFWSRTTVGDIAYFILMDLFTESDEVTFNLPGLSPPDLTACQLGAEVCWRGYVQEHGREAIQRQWRVEWDANKERVYWDDEARCFRVRH